MLAEDLQMLAEDLQMLAEELQMLAEELQILAEDLQMLAFQKKFSCNKNLLLIYYTDELHSTVECKH